MDPKKKWWQSFIKPSTLAFFKEASRIPGFTFYDRLHGYVYGRWPYLYIGLGTGGHPLAKRLARLSKSIRKLKPRRSSGETSAAKPISLPDPYPPQPGPDGVLHTGTVADTYHGKVIPLSAARQLVMVREPIALPQPETVIPFAKARDLILKNPDHIVALDCPCRASREHPCLPLDVCLIIGEPFASFVREHHPQRTRWITQDEAVEILRAEDERGHVHHAFFKDAMLGRFYAICNCCDCCCGAMQMQRHGAPMLISSGYICRVDTALCQACETCSGYCQFHALALGDLYMEVDEGKCMGCGVCVSKCPNEAVSLWLAAEKGLPLDISATQTR